MYYVECSCLHYICIMFQNLPLRFIYKIMETNWKITQKTINQKNEEKNQRIIAFWNIDFGIALHGKRKLKSGKTKRIFSLSYYTA